MCTTLLLSRAFVRILLSTRQLSFFTKHESNFGQLKFSDVLSFLQSPEESFIPHHFRPSGRSYLPGHLRALSPNSLPEQAARHSRVSQGTLLKRSLSGSRIACETFG